MWKYGNVRISALKKLVSWLFQKINIKDTGIFTFSY